MYFLRIGSFMVYWCQEKYIKKGTVYFSRGSIWNNGTNMGMFTLNLELCISSTI